jgi:hypothetical protein
MLTEAASTGPVEVAVEALLRDGAVVVTQAVEPALLERLAAAMTEDLAVLRQRPDRAENFAAGHLQQDPPPRRDLLLPSVLAHPFALEVCGRALGQPVRLSGYTNNTNLPGSEPQAVHVDEGQLWPSLDVAHPPARLIVNVPLSSTDSVHGAIELWPGTHTDPRMSQSAATPAEATARALQYVRAAKHAGVRDVVNRRVGLTIPEPFLVARRLERPPVRATTTMGSMIIRDPRLWHRGTPNTSSRTRFMLAVTYDPGWRREDAVLEFPAEARTLFERAGVDVAARFVDRPIDHLGRHGPPLHSPLRRASQAVPS